jgi:hypothetical protein
MDALCWHCEWHNRTAAFCFLSFLSPTPSYLSSSLHVHRPTRHVVSKFTSRSAVFAWVIWYRTGRLLVLCSVVCCFAVLCVLWRCCVVLCDVARCCVVFCGVVRLCAGLCGVLRCCAAVCGVVWCCFTCLFLLSFPQRHVSILFSFYKQFADILYFSLHTTSSYSGALSSLCLCGVQQACNCVSASNQRCSTNTPTRCGALRCFPRELKYYSMLYFFTTVRCNTAISVVIHQ